jgi:hypothetical protein
MNEFKTAKSTGKDVITLGAIFIFQGTAASAAEVYTEVGAIDAIGSLYISSVGGIYNQVANAGSSTDWQKVTTT